MKLIGKNYSSICLVAALSGCASPAGLQKQPAPRSLLANPASTPIFTAQPGRFVKLDIEGKPLENQHASYEQAPWRCVLDSSTDLIWEVKTRNGSFQDRAHTYTWYQPDNSNNGGFAGFQHQGLCRHSQCDTHAYVKNINAMQLCGVTGWRLPDREELRTLVRYDIRYPGPTIATEFFPNTLNQFYWSSVPSANEKEGAWGIGFSFGYDYAYFKSDYGSVRLVFGPLQ